MKKNVRVIVILVCISLLYVGIIFFFHKDYKPTEGYLIVSNLGGFYCNSSVCNLQDVREMKLDGKKIDTYQKNRFIGTYELQYLSKWNFLENGSWSQITGDFLGVEESLNAKVLDFTYEEFSSSDYEIIEDVLKKHEVNYYKYLDSSEVMVVDLDGNGELDRIFCISNQVDTGPQDEYFSAFFVLLNGNVLEVEFGKTDEIFTIPFYNLFSILRFDENVKPYFIVTNTYYDAMGMPSLAMYQLDGKVIQKV